MRVAAAVPRVHIADAHSNAEGALKIMQDAFREGVEIVVMPELSLVGYTCGDMVLQKKLLSASEKALAWLMEETADIPTIGIVGLPVVYADRLYNCAAIAHLLTFGLEWLARNFYAYALQKQSTDDVE
mgnify:CR=1 FL=1